MPCYSLNTSSVCALLFRQGTAHKKNNLEKMSTFVNDIISFELKGTAGYFSILFLVLHRIRSAFRTTRQLLPIYLSSGTTGEQAWPPAMWFEDQFSAKNHHYLTNFLCFFYSVFVFIKVQMAKTTDTVYNLFIMSLLHVHSNSVIKFYWQTSCKYWGF